MAEHWRSRRCEGSRHSQFCTYPDCECYFEPDTGELREDNDLVHGNVYFFRPDRRMEGDARGVDPVPVQDGRGEADDISAFHGQSEARHVRVRPEFASPYGADRDLRLIRTVFSWSKIAGALGFLFVVISTLVIVLEAIGAK